MPRRQKCASEAHSAWRGALILSVSRLLARWWSVSLSLSIFHGAQLAARLESHPIEYPRFQRVEIKIPNHKRILSTAKKIGAHQSLWCSASILRMAWTRLEPAPGECVLQVCRSWVWGMGNDHLNAVALCWGSIGWPHGNRLQCRADREGKCGAEGGGHCGRPIRGQEETVSQR